MSDPYDRVRRLREVGTDGIERFARSRAIVSRDAAGEVAERYLARMGFHTERIDLPPKPFPLEELFTQAGSRAVAEGAWRALEAVHDSLRAGASP